MNLYITSPNKKDGKTFLAAGICATMQSLGYKTSVYKPIETGCTVNKGFIQSSDLSTIKSIDPYIDTYFSYLFKSNTEPLLASEIENDAIDNNIINFEYKKILNNHDSTIIDGDSGLYSPLATNMLTIDLIKKMQIPLLFVITPKEDTINNILLSIHAAQEKNVEVRGVIINNIKEDCSKQLLTAIPRVIEEYTNVKILGLIPHLSTKFAPEDLISAIINGIDLESVFKVKIEKLDLI